MVIWGGGINKSIEKRGGEAYAFRGPNYGK